MPVCKGMPILRVPEIVYVTNAEVAAFRRYLLEDLFWGRVLLVDSFKGIGAKDVKR